MDREHERDFFQQEIQKLEQQLKSPQKLQGGSEQRNREVTRKEVLFCARDVLISLNATLLWQQNKAWRYIEKQWGR